MQGTWWWNWLSRGPCLQGRGDGVEVTEVQDYKGGGQRREWARNRDAVKRAPGRSGTGPKRLLHRILSEFTLVRTNTGVYSKLSQKVRRSPRPTPRHVCTRLVAGTVALFGLAVLAMAFTASACTNTEIVEVPRAPFNPAPDSVAGFLGLYTVADNQTTCGNCHVNNQTEWSGTLHAGRLRDARLPIPVSSRSATAATRYHSSGTRTPLRACQGGWNAVADSVYHNVQCESCHGPGLTHVTNPNSLNIPLASVLIPWKNLETGAVEGGPKDQSCSACHSGTHEPFAEQWAQSAHSNLRNEVGEARPKRATSCGAACHRGDGAMAKLSGNAPTNYIGKGTAFPITCAVCHDPHNKTNSHQLRAPIDNPDVTANLCTSCHVRSAVATPSFTINSRGAHASQGAVYFGEGAGWIPPGFVFDPNNPVQTVARHRQPAAVRGLPCGEVHDDRPVNR